MAGFLHHNLVQGRLAFRVVNVSANERRHAFFGDPPVRVMIDEQKKSLQESIIHHKENVKLFNEGKFSEIDMSPDGCACCNLATKSSFDGPDCYNIGNKKFSKCPIAQYTLRSGALEHHIIK